ncbi:MAG: phosphoglucosamine mutase [bacterium]|nr:phosphoglucosamine mutase [bacterium]
MTKTIISPSGVRGIVGESLTIEFAAQVAAAFGAYLGGGKVVLGGDTRQSYGLYHAVVRDALLGIGCDVIDIGQAPTPTHQQAVRHHQADGAMVITASHNPIQWNGLKMMNREGGFLSQAEFDDFKPFLDKDFGELRGAIAPGECEEDNQAIERHVARIFEALDVSAIRKSTLKVLVDVNNGTGAIADPILFEKLGIQVAIMNGEPNGIFTHTPEPVKENLSQIMNAMKEGGFDIGFVQDPDADRLVILDENGHFIGEDYSLALCVDYILSHSDVSDKKVVVNLSTSQVVEDVAARYGATTHYTKIGETHVTQGLRDLGAVVGGEGNGGVIYPKVGWGRDSLTGIVIALKYLAESGKSVSQIVSDYPTYVMHRAKREVASREEVSQLLADFESKYQGEKMDTQDGVKVYLADGWIQMRPSNTEPIVRIFTEAKDIETAQRLAHL